MAVIDCVKQVCDTAADLNKKLSVAKKDADALIQEFPIYMQHLRCVVTGPVGKLCVLPGGPAHTTLAEALARLNALSIGGITTQSFIATAGQTDFTLTAAPVNPAAVEVVLNGSEVNDPRDYFVTGTTLRFVNPLPAGDEVDVREFTV